MTASPITYLDENATATPEREAMEAAAEWLTRSANASSPHSAGRAARGAVERARRAVAGSLGVEARQLTFCASATEALHMGILGILRPGDHVVVSAVEHAAVWGALEQARRWMGVEVTRAPVSERGEVEPESFARALRPNTRLCLLMAAQSELGVVYPTRAIAERVSPVPLMCDAAQAWGKVPLHLPSTGASVAVVSGHKIGAPLGAAALWCAPEAPPIEPLLRGGGQERGRRAGTELTPALVGMGVAAARIGERLEAMREVRALRESLEARLSAHPALRVMGAGVDLEEGGAPRAPHEAWQWRAHARLPNTLMLRSLTAEGDLLLQALDLAGFCVSSGSACASGALEPSAALLALGYTPAEARRGLRVSLGPHTPVEGIWRFAEVLEGLLR
jgi:cysteine desulfurase